MSDRKAEAETFPLRLARRIYDGRRGRRLGRRSDRGGRDARHLDHRCVARGASRAGRRRVASENGPGDADAVQVRRRIMSRMLGLLDKEPSRGHQVARWLYTLAVNGELPEKDFGWELYGLDDLFDDARNQVYGAEMHLGHLGSVCRPRASDRAFLYVGGRTRSLAPRR